MSSGIPSSPAADSAWRAWLAAASALALAYALYVGRGGPYPIPLVLLTVAIAAAGAAVVSRQRPRLAGLMSLSRLLSFGLAVEFALLFVWPLTNPLQLTSPIDYAPFWIGLLSAAAIAAAPILGAAHTATWRLAALIGVHFALGLWVIAVSPVPFIDLFFMQADGAQALASGVNPYLPIYDNIHGADSPYYGPGLVVDGDLTIGFPYPPLSLIMVLPAELLAGDPRYAHLVAIGLTAAVLAAMRPGRVATGAALLYLFTPWTFFMVVGSWTEPLGVLLLAVVLLAAVRAPRWLGVSLGLLIAVKQYLLLALPLALVFLARRAPDRWRLGGQAVATAAVITVPFVLWDVGAFTWSTIGSLAGQIFRPDSLTYLAVLPGDWGPRLSLLAFVLLVPAAALIAWRAPRTPAGFAASLALLLLVFFAFSRQGSANYHFGVIGALCCAVAASLPADRPPVTRTASAS